MPYLEATGQALVDPLVEIWNQFALALPGLIAAAVILIIGLIVGSAFGLVLRKLLEKAKIDLHLKKAGVSIGFIDVAHFFGGVLKWWIVALFLIPAADKLNFGAVSEMIQKFSEWLPNLIAAAVILVLGVIAADVIADKMLHAKRKGVKLLSSVVRWVIIIYTLLIAAQQVGINVTLATNTALIIVGALAVGLAIALGIGFGAAFKDEAKNIIRAIKKKY